jgi:hypothetical protein
MQPLKYVGDRLLSGGSSKRANWLCMMNYRDFVPRPPIEKASGIPFDVTVDRLATRKGVDLCGDPLQRSRSRGTNYPTA